MDANDLEVGKFFTRDGEDMWVVESYFSTPSCTLRNLITGIKETFGMGGLTAASFKRVDMEPYREGE